MERHFSARSDALHDQGIGPPARTPGWPTIARPTLEVDREETRDLRKQSDQGVRPNNLPDTLGEYYTPDCLAERLLNQLGYDGNPVTRILDPSCGSGTFPVLEIKRTRKYIDDRMLPPAQALEQILEYIVGFDLNPLAVISSSHQLLASPWRPP